MDSPLIPHVFIFLMEIHFCIQYFVLIAFYVFYISYIQIETNSAKLINEIMALSLNSELKENNSISLIMRKL